MNNGTMFRRRELVSALRVSMSTIDRLIARGQLGAVRLGRAIRIPTEAVTDFVRRNRIVKPRRRRGL